MEPSRPFDGQSSDGFYLRGKAYLQAKPASQGLKPNSLLLVHPQMKRGLAHSPCPSLFGPHPRQEKQ